MAAASGGPGPPAKRRKVDGKRKPVRPEHVKEFYDPQLTEAWNAVLPDCAVESCSPLRSELAGVQVWCDMRVTQTSVVAPLAKPLHATISAACNLKPNAVLRHEAWQATHDKQLKAAETTCGKKVAEAELVLCKVRVCALCVAHILTLCAGHAGPSNF
jgi:hypothetical protein